MFYIRFSCVFDCRNLYEPSQNFLPFSFFLSSLSRFFSADFLLAQAVVRGGFYRHAWPDTAAGWSLTWWPAGGLSAAWWLAGRLLASLRVKVAKAAGLLQLWGAKFRFGPSIYDCSNCAPNWN